MKEFDCGSVVPDCNVVFRAPDEGSLLAQVVHHAREDHGMEELPPDVVDLVRARARDVD